LGVTNECGGSLEFTLSKTEPWLSLDVSTGNAPSNVNVRVDRSGLEPGTYTADISVTSNGGEATVEVSIVVPEPDKPQVIRECFNLDDIVVKVDQGEPGKREKLGTFLVGDHSFTVYANHGLDYPCYTPVPDSDNPQSVHLLKICFILEGNTLWVLVDIELSGNKQKNEVFWLEVNGQELDRGTGCPVVPDSGGEGLVKGIFAGKLQL